MLPPHFYPTGRADISPAVMNLLAICRLRYCRASMNAALHDVRKGKCEIYRQLKFVYLYEIVRRLRKYEYNKSNFHVNV